MSRPFVPASIAAAFLWLASPAHALTPQEQCAYDHCFAECASELEIFLVDCQYCAISEGNCETEQCITQFEGCLPGEICPLLYEEMVAGLCPTQVPSCMVDVLAEGEVCADGPVCDEACAAMPSLIDRANVQYGAAKIHDGARKKRLRPSSLEQELRTLLEALNDGGCTVQPTLQDDAAGAYNLGTRVVDLHASNAAGPQQGTVRKALKNLEGPIGPDQYGSAFSTWNDNGRFVADRSDGGFVAGRWVRTTGKRGVFVAAQGACDGSATPAEALETWLGADLSGWP